ncbi:hypothetical protein L1987_20135 [Smallanthus sonchifolius]|uniref:Uncharacterized protein n=1 Tax=Smallanthus sonchifolius TaxID=185202 RepID=A0ACB9IQI3_9ASTR|nr:hypothetical protein L1987_20135 [Smallanthus sonchifolius]
MLFQILGLDICADIRCHEERNLWWSKEKIDYSSTTYQIITCLQQLAHITDASILVSLLQPSPEAFDLFDDIMLMAEGMIVYHGPRSNVLEYFEGLGFKCPERKGVADFLQEVVSKKDQATYWCRIEEAYNYVSVHTLSMKFKESYLGKDIADDISKPFMRLSNHENAISFHLFIIAVITMTVFLRTRLKPDIIDANYYLGSLFYALVILLVDGFPESAMRVSRLPIFYKQRDMYFYHAWAYAIHASILKIPLSFLESTLWTCLSYCVIGYSPEPGRFFRHLMLLFGAHFTSVSMFRFLASVFQTVVASTTAGSISILFLLTFGGFIILHSSFNAGLVKVGILVLSGVMTSTNTTIGLQKLKSRGLDFAGHYYWISLGALLGFALLLNVGFVLALSFFKAPGTRFIISKEKISQVHEGKMVLPFEPLTITFQDLQYYVKPPPEMREHGFTGKRLQLLRDITGAFRPGVLTALMGASGAGKTTLLDVLAGRKTSGIVEREIRIGVEESVIFSAWLRLHPDIDSKTKYRFVEEILETVELYAIKDALVGIPGVSGLSTEQHKRLTIAVEVVANPSIIFMDEPTTGLDARSAAIVMRAAKNIVDTGRTIVCTIHQPSIDIFEAFDKLILLKNGGRMIYCGQLGCNSSRVIEYFESISGVPKIRDNYNPATWMLEVTSASVEAELGVDFGQIYSTSTLYESNKELVSTLSKPPAGSKDLYFPTRFPQNGWGQFKACLWKQHLSYWRSPSAFLAYALCLAYFRVLTIGFYKDILGHNHFDFNHSKTIPMNNLNVSNAQIATMMLKFPFTPTHIMIYIISHVTDRDNQQSLFNVLGSMFTGVLFCGINNLSSAIPYVSMERTVLYRERFSGMYASWAYAFAQVTIEFPYLLGQSLAFVCITYPMIGYYWSAYKVFSYFYTFLCTLMYFTYLGMLLVAVTPSFPVAAILQSAFYTIFNLFAGFLIPKPVSPC